MDDVVVGEKLVIIGLDGATWNVINPLIQKGQLPNLARLIADGTSGTLRSLEPMISTMLWTTISSGKLPDKHGVRDFALSAKAVRCKRLWDIFAQQGLTVGVYGHLITWPPEPIKGFIVPGTFALGPDTHPPDLSFLRKLAMDEASGKKRRYLEYLGHGWKGLRNGVRLPTLWQLMVHMATEVGGGLDYLRSFYRKRLLKLRLDCDVFCHLVRRFQPQFAYFYTHLLDSCQHLFWKYMEPQAFQSVDGKEVARYGQIIPEAYREADRTVGRILTTMGDDATVMVISDHGGQAAHGAREGSSWTIRTENLLRKLGLWEQVRAVNIGSALYLSPKGKEPGAREQMTERFQRIVAEERNLHVFKVTPMEYSYVRIQVHESNLERLKRSFIKVGQERCPFEEIVDVASNRQSGTHHPDGICILRGKSIKRGVQLDEASIVDIAPTALMLMGLAVARDMDGRALQEAATKDFLQTHSLKYRPTYEDEDKLFEEEEEDVSMPEELVKKLKTLGYLG
jgi:predicted AlkP superfamily phosphohydrolase/phosphomutase